MKIICTYSNSEYFSGSKLGQEIKIFDEKNVTYIGCVECYEAGENHPERWVFHVHCGGAGIPFMFLTKAEAEFARLLILDRSSLSED